MSTTALSPHLIYLSASFRRYYIRQVSNVEQLASSTAPRDLVVATQIIGDLEQRLDDALSTIERQERALAKIVSGQNAIVVARAKAEQQCDAALARASTAEDVIGTALGLLRDAGYDGPLTLMINDAIRHEKDAATILARKGVQLSGAFTTMRRQSERLALLQDPHELQAIRDELDRAGYGRYTLPAAIRELISISREHFAASRRPRQTNSTRAVTLNQDGSDTYADHLCAGADTATLSAVGDQAAAAAALAAAAAVPPLLIPARAGRSSLAIVEVK